MLKGDFSAWTRWTLVVVFAVAMAWLESATVYYLRVLVDRLEPYQANPVPMSGVLVGVELTREAATLVMILLVGLLAGRTMQARLGFAALAFGVWDIFYYVFLYLICGWPRSLFDWDVLFLLPLPWWGPVAAPMLIALLMILWGTLATVIPREQRRVVPAWSLSTVGIVLALYVFMADSIRAVREGLDVSMVLPDRFAWGLFVIALALMAAPVADFVWRTRSRHVDLV